MPKFRLFALALLVLAAAHAPAKAGTAVKPIWFFRAESADGRTTFFYPSFHLRDPRVPRPPMTMLDGIGRLVLEADIAQLKAHPETIRSYLIAPRPRDLSALFTPAQIMQIRARASCNGLGGAVEQLRLSFIATLLALPCPEGQAETRSYEDTVEVAAQQRGLKITGIETGEEEFTALAALPERLFIDQIKEMTLHPDRADKMIDRMVDLYGKGDLAGLYALMLSDMPKRGTDRKLFIDKVLLERNRRMVERLGDVLAEGNALVVVGALHFPGDGGIVDLLQQRGFRVTRIDGRDGALR